MHQILYKQKSVMYLNTKNWLTRTCRTPADDPDGFPVLLCRVVRVPDQNQIEGESGDRCPEEGDDAGEDGQGAVGLAVRHVAIQNF